MRIVQLLQGNKLITVSAASGSAVMVYQDVWSDTTIKPDIRSLNIWRAQFPNLVYRIVDTVNEIEEAEIKGEKVDSN
jgi:hypothetical protein